MKAFLDIEDGEITIKGKGISIELDSETDARRIEAQAKLNATQPQRNRIVQVPAGAIPPEVKAIFDDFLNGKISAEKKVDTEAAAETQQPSAAAAAPAGNTKRNVAAKKVAAPRPRQKRGAKRK